MYSKQPDPPARSHTDEPLSLLAFLHVLSVRRHTVLYCTVAGFVLALLASLLLFPTKFAATALLELNPDNNPSLQPTPVSSLGDHVESAVNLSTQGRILQSDELALRVITKLDLEGVERQRAWFHFGEKQDDALPLDQSPTRRGRMLRKFHRNLSVQVLGGTRLLEVHYLDRDPALAANVVHALLNDFLDQHFQARYTATRQASDWLAQQLATLKNDVESSQQRLADYQRQTGILGESDTNNVVIAKLEDLNKQLSAAEANRIVKEAVWQLAKSGDPELISSMAGTSLIPGIGNAPSQLSLLPTLRAQEAQLKADIAQTSARLGPSFPKLIQMRSQLAELQSSIQTELGKIAARAENDYLAAKKAEDMERDRFEKQKAEAAQLNDSAIQYGILKREADANRDLYQGLLGKLKEASVLAGLHLCDILVIDPPHIPDKPSTPNYLLNLPIGTALGLLFGLSAALIQDSTDRTLRSPDDITRSTNLPLYGVIPVQSEHGSRESDLRFRALRGALMTRAPRVLVITSPLPGEGKTTISLNLARALANTGRRVLLVDADLHRPSLHRHLQIENTALGLSELLTGTRADFAHEVGGITTVLAGTACPSALDQLDSSRMDTLIAKWRDQFDFVLIDTPPVLAYSDALSLAKSADSVLLVLRASQTTSDALHRSIELFEQREIKSAGAVLNALSFRSPYYKHYYGHDHRSLEERNV